LKPTFIFIGLSFLGDKKVDEYLRLIEICWDHLVSLENDYVPFGGALVVIACFSTLLVAAYCSVGGACKMSIKFSVCTG